MSKTLFSLSCALLSLSACAMESQQNYTVTLPVVEQHNNTTAYLIDWDSALKMDSMIVTDGVVKFEGHVDAPKMARFMINGSRGPVFVLEPGDIKIVKGERTGSPLNEKFQTYQNRITDISKTFKTLNRNDSADMVKARELRAEYDAVPAKAYAENKDNVLGLYFYMQDAYDKSLAVLESDMAANPVLASSKQVQALQNTLRVQAETGEGKHYKDFSVEYDGKTEKLSSYVKPGRYTIVDFWASWCGPCVRQLKVIKGLYAKYKDKGLDVVGVAVWDKPEDTLGAIKSHDLPWPCIINAQTIPTDLYGIQGIPCILLINPEGIIVSRDKQGDALVSDVDAAMASYQSAETSGVIPAAKVVPADSVNVK